jgi:signal transduction histidine kinase
MASDPRRAMLAEAARAPPVVQMTELAKPDRRRRRGRELSAVTKFALSGLAALVVVALGSGYALRRAANAESVRDARQVTEVIAHATIEPNLTDDLLTGSREAVRRLDRIVRGRVVRDPVVRVKLWTRDGRIVYSDEPRLIGSRYALDSDDLDAIRTGEVAAELSDLSRPENRFERSQRKLLEVYLPVWTPGGEPLIFESYLRFSSVSSDARRISLAVGPALAIALLVLWLVQLPLARGLARRLREGQRQQEELLVHALEASDLERRRIAADLHDGVVQDLAGISFSLAAAADRSGATAGETKDVLRQAAEGTRQSMRRLRSLLVEIYPPNLHDAGLLPALSDLTAPLAARGLKVTLDVAPDLDLPPALEQLLFRSAQEALRNVLAHADASSVVVRVSDDGNVTLVVEDDGRGFAPDGLKGRTAAGHFGLALIADRAADLGGRLEVGSKPGRGTRLLLEVPKG